MGVDVESIEQLIGLTAPEFSTPEAIQGLPDAQALYQQRVQEHDRASEDVKCRQAVCDTNHETLRFLRSKQEALSTELKALRSASNTELYELRSDCDVEGIGSLLRKKIDAIEFVDAAYNYLLLVKDPLDGLDFQDSLVNEGKAEYGELSQAALFSRMKTIALLGPIREIEGNEIGIIGAGSNRLKCAAQAALKRVETMKADARDARLAFDRAESARISTGLITLKNVKDSL
jgi:hypothetical protein